MTSPTNTYYIDLQGCDDSTSVTMQLTETEAALIERLAAKTRHHSRVDCMPTMTIRDRPNGSADNYDVEHEEY